MKKGVEIYKTIRADIRKAVPFYPYGLSKYGDGWLCLGLKAEKEEYISVSRMDGEESKICIPVKGNKTEILYPSDLGAEIEYVNGNVIVSLPEKYNAVLIKVK